MIQLYTSVNILYYLSYYFILIISISEKFTYASSHLLVKILDRIYHQFSSSYLNTCFQKYFKTDLPTLYHYSNTYPTTCPYRSWFSDLDFPILLVVISSYWNQSILKTSLEYLSVLLSSIKCYYLDLKL